LFRPLPSNFQCEDLLNFGKEIKNSNYSLGLSLNPSCNSGFFFPSPSNSWHQKSFNSMKQKKWLSLNLTMQNFMAKLDLDLFLPRKFDLQLEFSKTTST